MNKQFIDVVNLNADASCLPLDSWLSCLEGGENSTLYQWLDLYRSLNRKVSLGATGTALADIASGNPETLDLIRANPQIFEIVGRPYAHDIATTRSPKGFTFNLQVGIKAIEETLHTRPEWYLPPEFMVTPQQIHVIREHGYKGIFILPDRFSERDRGKVPSTPFAVRGTAKSSLACVPCKWSLTKLYLAAIQQLDGSKFYAAISESGGTVPVVWRDGESPFLLPDSVQREKHWLLEQPDGLERIFLSELNEEIDDSEMYYYPLHSFQNWMEDLKLLGYLHYVQELEAELDKLCLWKKAAWFELINSDILSSIEKSDPVIDLVATDSAQKDQFVITRSKRYYEAQDLVHLLEDYAADTSPSTDSLGEMHRVKVDRRIDFLRKLLT